MVTHWVSHGWWKTTAELKMKHSCMKITFSASLLVVLYSNNNFENYAYMSSIPESIMFMYAVCLCVWPSPVWRSRRTEPLGTDAPVCAWSLGLRSECQALCVFVVCMPYRWTHACVCGYRREWVWRMPVRSRTAQLHTTREMWHKESSEQEGERVCLFESVCVHFLNALLTTVGYERGLVLQEQMAEC